MHLKLPYSAAQLHLITAQSALELYFKILQNNVPKYQLKFIFQNLLSILRIAASVST